MSPSSTAQHLDLSAPHLTSPDGSIRSWITPRPGMLNVAAPGAFVGAAGARFITSEVEAEMKRRHPRAERFLYVHDFSGAGGYEPEARRILTTWGLARIPEVERVVIVTSRTHSFIRMAVSTAEAVLRAAGMDIEVSEELAPVLERYALL